MFLIKRHTVLLQSRARFHKKQRWVLAVFLTTSEGLCLASAEVLWKQVSAQIVEVLLVGQIKLSFVTLSLEILNFVFHKPHGCPLSRL
jgi:hypothetical protein